MHPWPGVLAGRRPEVPGIPSADPRVRQPDARTPPGRPRASRQAADIMVRRIQIDYDRPVHGRIVTHCRMPGEKDRERFAQVLNSRGKARWNLTAEVEGNDFPAVVCRGVFVAVRTSALSSR